MLCTAGGVKRSLPWLKGAVPTHGISELHSGKRGKIHFSFGILSVYAFSCIDID